MLAQRRQTQRASDREQEADLATRRQVVEEIGCDDRAKTVGDDDQIAVAGDRARKTCVDRLPSLSALAEVQCLREELLHEYLDLRALSREPRAEPGRHFVAADSAPL